MDQGKKNKTVGKACGGDLHVHMYVWMPDGRLQRYELPGCRAAEGGGADGKRKGKRLSRYISDGVTEGCGATISQVGGKELCTGVFPRGRGRVLSSDEPHG